MQRNAAFHQGIHCFSRSKYIQTKELKKNENHNLTPLDVLNGLSKVYGILSGGRAHQNKGLTGGLGIFSSLEVTGLVQINAKCVTF